MCDNEKQRKIEFEPTYTSSCTQSNISVVHSSSMILQWKSICADVCNKQYLCQPLKMLKTQSPQYHSKSSEQSAYGLPLVMGFEDPSLSKTTRIRNYLENFRNLQQLYSVIKHCVSMLIQYWYITLHDLYS